MDTNLPPSVYGYLGHFSPHSPRSDKIKEKTVVRRGYISGSTTEDLFLGNFDTDRCEHFILQGDTMPPPNIPLA